MPRVQLDAAAELLGVERSVLKYWCRQGKIRHVRVGHQWLFDPDDLAAFVEAHTVEPTEGPSLSVDSGR
jgi:excisionase family DNA binding protein